MRILVTGGAGYIGSTLVPRLLARGHAVRVLDLLRHGGEALLPVWSHPAFELRRGDVRDATVVADAVAGMDAVVHLAAIVGDPACAREPEVARQTNLDASIGLLAASRLAGVSRFVFASTCSNYGRMADPEVLVDEDSDLRPISLYAETKVAVERELLAAALDDGLCATPLRLATVFGVSPRMRFDLTVNEFAMELAMQHRLVVFGERFWRPYVHVRDVARAIEAVLEAPRERVAGRVFNVGATEENYRKQEIVELVRSEVPGAEVEYVHRDEDPRDYRVSFARINSELGFFPSRSVADGVHEVVQLVRTGLLQDVASPRYRN
ncbi:MAG: NAD-dependent epimerase/dehydratase family protein [Gemmatimonadaceae bacterium]